MVGADILADGRLAKRISAQEFGNGGSLEFTIRDLSMASMEVKLLDISETGLGIMTKSELVLGQIFNIIVSAHLKLPKKAVVMWSRKGMDGYRAGLKFIRAN